MTKILYEVRMHEHWIRTLLVEARDKREARVLALNAGAEGEGDMEFETVIATEFDVVEEER